MDGDLLLSTAGVVGELAGLAIAAVGFRQTWREWEPDEAISWPLTQALDRLTSWLTRVFRTGLPPKVVHGQASLAAAAVLPVRASVERAPLPSITEAPEQFAKMVELRLTDLLDRVEKAARAQEDAEEAAKEREAEIRSLIDRYRAESQANVKKVAVGGLRLQAIGWALTILGVAFQGIGQIIQ